MCEYIAVAKSTESYCAKKSRLTTLLRQEENHSKFEAHFEGTPNWRVVIAKIESFSELLRLSEHECSLTVGSANTPGTSESS